jgi:hypothetical protein
MALARWRHVDCAPTVGTESVTIMVGLEVMMMRRVCAPTLMLTGVRGNATEGAAPWKPWQGDRGAAPW